LAACGLDAGSASRLVQAAGTAWAGFGAETDVAAVPGRMITSILKNLRVAMMIGIATQVA
jgi:hypothetical protein